MRARLESGSLDEALAEIALAAAMPEPYPIGVRRLKSVGTSAHLELAHYLAAALAITFTGFTALIGSASLLQENAQWTLQRMHTTPTPSGIILGGKTLGTYLNSLTQLCVLMGGLMAWQWLRANGLELEPEVSLPGLAVLALAVAAASTGVGTVIAGFSRTYAQAANYGRALLVLMGLVGGIFFPVELFPKPVALLSRLTFQYWAMDGYLKLALGGSAASIVPHVVVLVAMGSLFFVIGSRFLRRRIGFL
jgi:ABC-2 type transport system permease protein